MFHIHAFSVNIDDYDYHHKTQASFKNRDEAMLSALKMLKLLHDTLGSSIQLMTMENKTVSIEEQETKGVMVFSSGIPYSFFVSGIELENSPIMYDPDLPPSLRVNSVPEC